MGQLSFLATAFCLVVLIGSFAVRSAAGFGATLIAVPMLAFVLPVSTVVSVVTVLSAVASAGQMRSYWANIAWRQLLIVSSYSLIGIGLGFLLMRNLDENALRHGLAAFLVLYSIYALWSAKAALVLPARWRRSLAAGAGISAGFFGVLFGGGSGPIYALYFNVLRMDKDAFRVTVSTVILAAALARIGGYASFGLYGRSAMKLLAAGLPLVFVGSWLGDRLVQRLNPQRFGWFVGGLVCLSGVGLLFK